MTHDTATGRRHGFHRRSDDWRNPAALARLASPVARELAGQIADALDDLEQRDGPAERRGVAR